ncbi:hypothetical protein AMAG_15325 [Allomyces macrogynus ATCC 38327]|uniref:Uncharacterized protein n=1 Tax=Allomyces macrogynus (strain ATCC 38327) TaxID=578462 RepID=A0A0L0T8J8_ALLM3|nr:hypothetical protein AMAG_15325 [Allomyces macrogynus ATCC 38327]|eukprot:KNE71072.1 hypothetical protein AMAG_15325 [Allomyces macrogynus ATCC 38327]
MFPDDSSGADVCASIVDILTVPPAGSTSSAKSDPTVHRAPIECLPYDVLEIIAHWTLRSSVWALRPRASLLHLALASPVLFVPSVSTVLREHVPSTGPFVVHDRWYNWQNEPGYDSPSPIPDPPRPGQFVVVRGATESHHSFLVLPQRSNRVLKQDAQRSRDAALRYWTTIPVPQHQLEHATISSCDLGVVSVPRACRWLMIVGDFCEPWPVCPLPVQLLKLHNFSILHTQLPALVASFPINLTNLTVDWTGVDNKMLSDLYDRLPSTLAALTIHDNRVSPHDPVDHLSAQSSPALSRALARLLHLTVFDHHLLFRPDDVVHVLNGLALAQAAGKTTPTMQSVTLFVHVDLDPLPITVPLVPQARALRILDFSFRMGDEVDLNSNMVEHASYFGRVFGVLPTPLRSLNLHAPLCPDRVIAHAMPQFASPTLQSLRITALPQSFGSKFEEVLLRRTFRLSSLGRLDALWPALRSLTLTPCLPPAMDGSTWALPPFLRSLNLMHSIFTSRDLDSIWPRLPASLQKLNLDRNQLEFLPPSFPPTLRMLSVASNDKLSDATCWIDALPPTLRLICVDGCRLDEDAGRRLLQKRRLLGVRILTGEAKMKVYARGNWFSRAVWQALEAEQL